MINAQELSNSQKYFIIKDFAKYLSKRNLLKNGAVYETLPQYGIYADNGFYSLDKILDQFNNSSNKTMLKAYLEQIKKH